MVIEQLRANPNQLGGFGLTTLWIDVIRESGEYFFTGGGLHYFNNFNNDDNGKIMSVRDALRVP